MITGLVVAAQFPAVQQAALVALATWVPLSLFTLYAAAGRLHPGGAGPGIPNLLTGVRVTAATIVLALAAADTSAGIGPLIRSGGFVVAGALGIVELTDFLDGYFARRSKTTRFGPIWDMENDAALAIGLAVGLRHFYGVGVHILIIGLMRYLYVLVWRYDGDPVTYPAAYKQFAKTVAAIIVTSLIVGFVPILPPIVRTVGFAVVLALQVVSFSWDLLLQRRSAHG